MDPFLVQPVVSAPAAAQPASALVRSRGGSPDPTGAAPPQPMILNTDIAPAAMTVSTRSRAAAGNASAAAPVPHGSGVKHREGKAPVSHSTIEKQRRDRINSLIDELRDLVPPHSHPLPHDDLEGHPHDGAKRPKHAVLSDTIALVKELKSKLSVAEDEMARLGRISPKPSPFSSEAGDALMAAPRAPMAAAGVAAGGCLGQTAQEGTAPMPIVASTEAGGLVSAHVPPPSPSAPNGVSVDPGEGCMYVKVHCKDRHGLLADIVRSLKAINLEITTAAITTTASEEGAFVYDVFQVKAPGSPTASADDIKATVEAAMGAGAAAVDGHAGKRLRSALA